MTPRCQALIYKRDTYRRTGRGRSGFEMHYTKEQCSHAAIENGRCGKHPACRGFMTCKFAVEFKEEK